tara:strand:+ start:157 stop:402 length:246 start_codon:yes stop_codon:yes gene_type:complete
MTTTVREAEKKGFDFKGLDKKNPRSIKVEITKAKKEIQRLRIVRKDCKSKTGDCKKINALLQSEIRRLASLQNTLIEVLQY